MKIQVYYYTATPQIEAIDDSWVENEGSATPEYAFTEEIVVKVYKINDNTPEEVLKERISILDEVQEIFNNFYDNNNLSGTEVKFVRL